MSEQTKEQLQIVRSCPFAPPAQHLQLQSESPVAQVEFPTGQTAWVATRYDDIRAILNDTRFSSDRRHPGSPQIAEQLRDESGSIFPRMMLEMDPPEHGPVRRAVVGEFTVKRVAALGPRIQEIVDEHIDAILAGPKPVDLVQALSLPVPSLVICELLGVPYTDHKFFQVQSGKLVSREATPDERSRAALELGGYLDGLLTAKEENPGDDLLSRQILKQREDGHVDHRALLGMAMLLLTAGHETTANMISLSTVALLENPDQLAALRDDPANTLGAVEELLRYFTIAEYAIGRVATEDVQLGDVVIPAGQGMLPLINTGNRDSRIFADADVLDIKRGARHHLAFGFGPHQCLGQNLARLELQIVFDTLFRRIPTLRLAKPLSELPFKNDTTIYGLHELPVTW